MYQISPCVLNVVISELVSLWMIFLGSPIFNILSNIKIFRNTKIGPTQKTGLLFLWCISLFNSKGISFYAEHKNTRLGVRTPGS